MEVGSILPPLLGFWASQKTMSRSRNMCFTLNADDPEPLLLLDPSSWPHCKFCVYQREVGTHEHFQGYMEFDEKLSYVQVHTYEGMARAALFARRGTAKQAAQYCRKTDETYVEGPWEYGEQSHQGMRQDLLDVYSDIKQGSSLKRIADDHPVEFIKYPGGIAKMTHLLSTKRGDFETTVCFVFFGAGGSGKSTTARRLARYLSGDKDTYVVPEEKGSGLYWDGYNQGDVCIIDEFKGSRMKPTMFNMLIDAGPCQVPVHGGTMEFNSLYVIITTNVHPQLWWPKVEFKRSLRRRIIMWPIFRNLAFRPKPKVHCLQCIAGLACPSHHK